MNPHDTNAIVEDGYEHARAAAIEKVRAEVEMKFAPQLARAGLWRRWLVRLQMRREIERRLRRVAPPDALYSQG